MPHFRSWDRLLSFYDPIFSVSDETREAIFATAEKIGYKKRVIYPKIENVALLYFVDHEDELEDVFYHGVKDEIIKQAKKMNIQLSIYDRKDGMDHVPKDLSAFIAIGWLTRKEINALYKRCKRGVFIGTSPDEKLFDAVKPNMDSFVTHIILEKNNVITGKHLFYIASTPDRRMLFSLNEKYPEKSICYSPGISTVLNCLYFIRDDCNSEPRL